MICYISIFLGLHYYFKKEYFISLVLFFFMLLEGFQVIPNDILTFGFFSRSSLDAALFFLLILFILKGKYLFHKFTRLIGISNSVNFFGIFFIINVVYGLFLGYNIIDIFKGARNYIFLFSLLFFTDVPYIVLIKLVRFFIGLTFFQSILFLFQILLGQAILQSSNESFFEDINFTRFYNSPKLLDFSLAFCLFKFPFSFNPKFRYLFIAVFILTIIGPLHRGYILAWLFVSFIMLLIFIPNYLKLGYSFIGLFFIFLLNSVGILKYRFSNIIEEFSVLSDIYSNKINIDVNTFSYRLSHLSERMSYLNSEFIYWIIGIGFVDESSPEVFKLPFKYGLVSQETGLLVKVYTPDLVWSMLFLTMGYIGSMVYLNIFFQSFRKLVFRKWSNSYSKILFVLIMMALITSFTSNYLINPVFFVSYLLVIVLVEKSNNKNVYCG